MSDIVWLTPCELVAAWFLFCWAMSVRENRTAPGTTVTDPGADAVRALVAPQPFPTGKRRLPSPGAEFEGTRHLAACDCGRPIPTGRTAYCSDRCRWNDDNHGSN
jgi:hypothetical protein